MSDKMTRDEELAMYLKSSTKRELAEMLVSANRALSALASQVTDYSGKPSNRWVNKGDSA